MRPSTILVAATFLAASLTAGAARAEESSRAVICAVIDRAAGDPLAARLVPHPADLAREQLPAAGGQPGRRQGHRPVHAGHRQRAGPHRPVRPGGRDPRLRLLPLGTARQLRQPRSRGPPLYNAGPGRIARWRSGEASLPDETRAHVRFVTGANLTADARDGDAGRHADTAPTASRRSPRSRRRTRATCVARWRRRSRPGASSSSLGRTRRARARRLPRPAGPGRRAPHRAPADRDHHAARRARRPVLLSHPRRLRRPRLRRPPVPAHALGGAACLTVRN